MSAWGWECRARLIKQGKSIPTQKRPTKWDELVLPGPGQYEPPKILGGPGFSKIRRAPAYSLGLYVPTKFAKPAAKPNAMQYNIRGMTRKGIAKIPLGVIAEKYNLPVYETMVPGPGAYTLKDDVHLKRAPTYSMRAAAKPPYEAWDHWTPAANMYQPLMMGKKPPAYSLGIRRKQLDDSRLPGPGEYNPKFDWVQKSMPAFSFGHPFSPSPRTEAPAPNTYCEKRLMYSKKSSPAPSFGIRHSKYLGKNPVHEIPSKLELIARDLL